MVRASLRGAGVCALVAAGLFISACSGCSNEKVIQAAAVLAVTPGPRNPVDSVEAPGSQAVPALQLTFSGDPRVQIQVNALTVNVDGAIDAVSSLKLVRDVNANGVAELSDVALSDNVKVDDKHAATFTLTETLEASASEALLVVANVDPQAQPGKSFAVSLAANSSVQITTSSDAASVTGAPVVGGTKTVGLVGALTLTAGKDNPQASKESPEVTNLPALQFVAGLGAEAAEGVRITAITVTAEGTANDADAVAAVRLFRDENRNGTADDGIDVRLGGSPKFDADDGTVTFGDLSEVVRPGGSETFLVVFDLAGKNATGKTVSGKLAANTSIVAVGALSSKPVPVVGAPLAGGEKTIASDGGLTISAGISNPGDTNEPLAAANVSMMQLSLKASSNQAVKVSSVVLRASGSGNDAAGINSVRLFEDKNNNGLLDPALDVQIGSGLTYSADDGTVSFTDLDELIPAGTETSWIVVYNFSPSAVPGQRFRAGIAANSAVTAVDPTTNAALAVVGAPVQGGIKTISTSGSLNVSAGVSNPGNTNEAAGALSVSMLQFSLVASTVENVKVSSMTVRGGGSGKDEANVTAVRLYRDGNGNGLYDSATDVQVGTAQTYPEDNGAVTFGGLSEVVTAGTRTNYIVVYDFAANALPGSTFTASIASGAAVTATGSTSGGVIAPVGAANGSTKTIQTSGTLSVVTGISNPGATNESASATDVSMLQFTLQASSVEDIAISGVTVRASGSGNDATAITGATLYRDVNGNGLLDTSDKKLAGPSTFPMDNGAVTFAGFSDVITAGGRDDLIVTFDFNGTAQPGQSFAASISAGTAIIADGVTSKARIVPGGSAAGATKTIQTTGSLSLATGVASPGATNEAAGATGVSMLQFTLSASTVEDVKISSMVVRAGGSANDATTISAVKLYRDVNGNGIFDGGDVALGSAQTFNADNGTCSFDNLTEVVAAGGRKNYVVTYDFNGTAQPGQNFNASIAGGAAVIATGATSGGVIFPGGSASGSTKTIQTSGSLNLAAGVSNPGSTNEGAAASDVSALQFTLSASSVEDVSVTGITVRASGSGNDATGISGVRLYRDENHSGTFDAGDTKLAGPDKFTADNGAITWTLANEKVVAGARTDYVVVFDFAGNAFPGQTFSASLPTGAAVEGIGVTSKAKLVASGSANGNTKTIQTTGSLSVAAGVANPGPTNEAANAADVPMLQFTLASSTVEDVLVSSITVRANGSGNDATALTGLKLYRDVNNDGTLDASVDVALGGTAKFGMDNGAATFTGLTETIAAGGRTNYLVTATLSGSAMPGDTFSVSITTGTAVDADGVSSKSKIAAGGSAGGSTKTVQTRGSLSVNTGVANPGPTNEGAGATDVSMMQFNLSAGTVEDVTVTAVTLRASGSGDDGTGVSAVRLYRDVNGNGVLDSSDVKLAGPAKYSGDNGTLIFSGLNEKILAGGRTDYLVTSDFDASALAGQTFATSISTGAAVICTGVTSRSLIVPSGSASGPTKTIQTTGSLNVATGIATSGNTNESASASDVSMLQFTLSASTVEDVKVTAVTVRASGSGDDATGISAVELYRDVDGNGQFNTGDVKLGTAQKFAGDNGIATFTGLTEVISAGGRQNYLVVYDFAGTALAGQTFAAAISTGSAIDCTGVLSKRAITPSGSAGGNTKTVQNTGSLNISTGISAPGPTNEAANASGVSMLQFTLNASTVEDVKVTAVTVRASGSGDDVAGITSVLLYRDEDGNGLLGTGDTKLGTAQTFNGDNGSATFSGLTETVAAGGRENYLVVYTFSGQALAGQTFAAAIATGAAIDATGALSKRAIVPSGGASGSTKTIQTTGSLNVTTGVSSPGPTNESASATGVSMLQFTVNASTVEDVKITGVTVRASGSGDDVAGISGVELYRDVNGNGQLGSGDVKLGTAQKFNSDNGTVTFANLTETILAGGHENYVVVFNYAGTALAGQTFSASIATGAALDAVGALSKRAITPSGSAGGSTKTIQNTGSLNISTGIASPGPTNESAAATGVSMLQFTLNASTVEDVKVTAVTVRTSGSGDDAAGLTGAELYRDVDDNGLLSVGDVKLGTLQKFAADNGAVTFANLSETVLAGDRENYIVTYSYSGQALAGQTFAASIATGAAIDATGVLSKRSITPSGSAGGSTKTIQTTGSLNIATGIASPGPTNESAAASGVSMLQFTLSASTVEDVKVTAVTVRASGSGDDAAGISGVELYRDVDGNGVLNKLVDVKLGTTQKFAADNGAATFSSLAETITAGGHGDYLVAFNFNGSALAGQTFAASISTGAAIDATGALSKRAITPSGSAGGSTKTIQTTGSLNVATGVSSPGPTNESAAATGVSMLQFSLSASTVEDVSVSGVTIRASGSANDQTAISNVWLWRDVDGDGVVSTGDVKLSTTAQKFSADNGIATFSGLTETILAGGKLDYVVTFDFAGNAFPGQTFAASISTGASVISTGVTSKRAIVPSGSASGSTKTIQTTGSLSVAAGVANPGPTNEAADAAKVPMLQFTLTASTVEDVKVTSVTVRAGGSGDDLNDVSAVELYRDNNENGRIDVGEPKLGSSATFASDNGTATITFTDTVLAGDHETYLVLYTFKGSALPGTNFNASVSTGAAVTAVGVASKGAITPSGGAGGNTKTIQTTGAISLFTGVSSPGPTNESAGATAVSMLQLTFTTNAVEAVKISAITVRTSGSGDDSTGISAVKLYRDVNDSGSYESGTDVQIGTAQTFSTDNGTATFTGLNETIAANGRGSYVVTYDFAGNAVAGQTFATSISTGLAVTAQGVSSKAAITPSGSASGSVKTVQNAAISMTLGPANPAAGTVLSSAVKVPMMQVELIGGTTAAIVRSFTINGGGSAFDPSAVTAVRLYRDTNKNGLIDSGEPELAPAQTFPSDNGNVTWAGLAENLAAASRLDLLVVYDLSGSATAGQTLNANVGSNAFVVAYDATTGQRASVSGAGLTGEVKTIAAEFNAWAPISTVNAPTSRTNHTAVAANGKMIIWGGDIGSTVRGDGASYDPASDTWTTLPTAGAPAGRTSHVAAFAGTKMLVWGGVDNAGNVLNTGGVYDVSANAWGTVAAPPAGFVGRLSAVAVSTGTEIIIWGGYDANGNPLGDGVRYNPGTNTWTLLPSAGAPTARYAHTAVWTGSKLIVWGGFGATGYTNSGALWDSGTNTWTALPGSPLASIGGHTAVWNGTEMVIYGGYDGGTYYGSGAAYSVTNGTWRSLPGFAAPAGRNQHTAVYTGKMMIVWGGWNGGPLDTGARLTTLNNTWSATNQSGAPGPRSGHTAVYVGGKMVVWGGASSTAYLGNGAVYTP